MHATGRSGWSSRTTLRCSTMGKVSATASACSRESSCTSHGSASRVLRGPRRCRAPPRRGEHGAVVRNEPVFSGPVSMAPRYASQVVTRVLPIALLLSVGANAYLLATRPAREPEQQHARSKQPTTRRPIANEQSVQGSAATASPALPVSTDIKNLDRAELEKRVTETEAKVAKLLPLSEKF